MITGGNGMKKWQKALLGTMLSSTILIMSCSTLGSYSLPPLNKRTLRVSLEGPWTEYRWYDQVLRKCGPFKLLNCYDSVEHIEKDFDFTNPEDRKKFFAVGFECAVRKQP
jgi:hypothetical protein